MGLDSPTGVVRHTSAQQLTKLSRRFKVELDAAARLLVSARNHVSMRCIVAFHSGLTSTITTAIHELRRMVRRLMAYEYRTFWGNR